MTKTIKELRYFFLLILAASFISVGLVAQADQGDTLSEQKPFADAHIILQVSDAEKAHGNTTLDIANNLMKHYGGQDKVDIEVIAFGAGISLLYNDSGDMDHQDMAKAGRVASLIEHGVRFYACGNTLDTIERNTGKRPTLLPGVETVQTGVAFMISEVNRGYTLVHP